MCGLDCSNPTGTFSSRNSTTGNGQHARYPKRKILLQVRMSCSVIEGVLCGLGQHVMAFFGQLATTRTISQLEMACPATRCCDSSRIAKVPYGSRRRRG